MRDVEVDASVLIGGPLETVHSEMVAQQGLAGRPHVGEREHPHVRVAEEYEAAAGSQDPPRLGDPGVGVAPDRRAVFGDGEVEARVAEGRPLGVRVDQGEAHVELALQPARRRELSARVVEPHGAGAAAREPRRHVARPAPELDDVQAVDIGEEPELGFGHAPDAPGDVLGRPRDAAAFDPRTGDRVPGGPVPEHVIVAHAPNDSAGRCVPVEKPGPSGGRCYAPGR